MKMKNLIFAAFLFPVICLSQSSYSGKIIDENLKPLQGAHIRILESYRATVSNADGEFIFSNILPGTYIVNISYIGYNTIADTIYADGDIKKNYFMTKSVVMTDEVVISSVRATENMGMAYSNITEEEISEENFGQDIPYLLNLTPSVVVTSDAGAGIGYTGIRIRGTDGTRINVTVNGIPFNDAESQQLYWVDIPDLASSLSSAQIIRGAGTSTNGAGAFGASIHLQTSALKQNPYVILSNSIGSFNTVKNTFEVGSGLLNNRWSFDGRLSRISSDGFIDRAFSDLNSFYVSGGYYGRKSLIRANVFSGKEKTYQAWYGVPEDSLPVNRTFNPAGLFYDKNSNLNFYDNQTDNYKQDHYQLLSATTLSGFFTLQANLHYTKGRGYYEEYKEDAKLISYNIPPVIQLNDTLVTSDLVRQKWLDNDFYGLTWSLIHDNKRRSRSTLGGGYNNYRGRHFGQVTWTEISAALPYPRYYNNAAEKNDFNIYLKSEYNLTKKIIVYGDIQWRKVNYSFVGFGADFEEDDQQVELIFINPKAGITFNTNPAHQFYFSYSRASNEPSRDEYVYSTPISRPRPEFLNDIEAGHKFRSNKISTVLNFFFMQYTDHLVLTGQINDVGEYVRSNISDSYRAGFEAEVAWVPYRKIQLSGNLSLSENKVKNFIEFIDNYDTFEQESIEHKNTDIAFSPSVVSAAKIEFSPVKIFKVSFIAKYVGQQFLDNTSNQSRSIDPYLTNDIRLAFSKKFKRFPLAEASFAVKNLLNVMYESNGYTFSYIYDGNFTTENYYYPQSGRHYLLKLDLKF